ncbi:hypothetical protein FRC06_008108, partial [Ceratobasidium sp. 370]
KGVSLEDMDQLFGYTAPGNDYERGSSPTGSATGDPKPKGEIEHEEIVHRDA